MTDQAEGPTAYAAEVDRLKREIAWADLFIDGLIKQVESLDLDLAAVSETLHEVPFHSRARIAHIAIQEIRSRVGVEMLQRCTRLKEQLKKAQGTP